MALTPGTRLGPYEIVSPLGAGGMGEVYRARDTRLDRTVAVKILPETLAADPQFRDRFDREARAISQLSHPHICPLFDVGEQSGLHFLVMECLDGETLADQLARFPDRYVPLADALRIAVDVGQALDAAHRRGIVHRDLKPGNIMLTKAGAKLLDFGLAKCGPVWAGTAGRAGVPTSVTSPPTMTSPLTEAGVILGTIQYMSPEQLHGMEADARSDIFSFGALLYEMLTGKKAFSAKSQVGVMAAILEHNPPALASVQPMLCPALVRLVETCLAKDPDGRWQNAGDLARELEYLATNPERDLIPRSKAGGARVRTGIAIGGAVGIAALSALGTWAALYRTPAGTEPPVHFTITPSTSKPLAHSLALSAADDLIAVARDGRSLVYVASEGEGQRTLTGPADIWVRRLDQLVSTRLPNLGTPRGPFLSPDGKWIGYFDGQTALRKVSIAGGAPITICPNLAPGRGATWGPDNTIVFATAGAGTGLGLWSVPAGGGEPTTLTRPDASRGEGAHWYPSFLPDGHAVLFAIGPTSGINDSTNLRIAVLDVKTRQYKTLLGSGTHPIYVEPPGARGHGYLVYAISGSLRAVEFDPVKLDVVGDPVPVLDDVQTVGGAAQFAVAQKGTLVYVPGTDTGLQGALRSLTWYDRRGREEQIAAPARAYAWARLSPDETTIALDLRDQMNDIWTFDIKRQSLTRVTTDLATDGFPIWTRDGRTLLFESNRVGGVFNVFRQSADGSGAAEQLTTSTNQMWPTSLSSDGTRLLVQETTSQTGRDIDVLALLGHALPEPLIHTRFAENNGELSPDSRWLAYQANDSGIDEVYVRPFPAVNTARWQVSTGGGRMPAWAGNGRELFYLAGRNMMAVPIRTAPAFSAGTPTTLFEVPPTSSPPMRYYDVTRDAQKFLLIKNPATSVTSATSMVVALNWVDELKAKMPTK